MLKITTLGRIGPDAGNAIPILQKIIDQADEEQREYPDKPLATAAMEALEKIKRSK
jgi:hypothetical protein